MNMKISTEKEHELNHRGTEAQRHREVKKKGFIFLSFPGFLCASVTLW